MEFDVEKSCRICLNESFELKNIFSSLNLQILNFIKKITGFEIENSNLSPNKICLKCESLAFNAFEFHELCIKSFEKLKNENTFKTDETDTFTNDNFDNDIKKEIDIDENFIQNNEVMIQNIEYTDRPEIVTLKKTDSITQLNDQIFQCPLCPKIFKKEISLRLHQKKHVKKLYTCEQCGEEFHFKHLLKIHHFKHGGEAPFICSSCGKECYTPQGYQKHLKIHDNSYSKKIITCPTCQKQFKYMSYLKEHLKKHTGEKPHKCGTCGKTYRQVSALHYHQKSHSGYKPFVCTICDERFLGRSVLNVHMRKHTDERPYVCDICGVAFKQITDMSRHRKIHTNEKSVLCNLCGRTMSSIGQLKVHMRTHTGEKPYICSICEKGFITKSTLIKHLRTHTGERPYSCKLCGKSFGQNSTLKTHLKTHRNEDVDTL